MYSYFRNVLPEYFKNYFTLKEKNTVIILDKHQIYLLIIGGQITENFH